MILPMMNFKKTLLKQYSTKILHTKHIRTLHSELQFTRRSQMTQRTDTAQYQPTGPIDRPSTPRRLQQNPIAAEKSTIIPH